MKTQAFLLFCLIVLFACSNRQEDESKQPFETKTDTAKLHQGQSSFFINPPSKKFDIKSDSFIVNSTKEYSFKYKTGSEITIPENAFFDKSGKLYTGETKLKYRELHRPLDFFLAGIPMTYYQNGTEHLFESAGMLQITAFTPNNEELIMNPEKKINVKMTSYRDGDYFETFYLDTAKKNWIRTGKDRLVKKDSTKIITTNNLPYLAPKPILADFKQNVFELENLNLPEELSIYKNLLFQNIENHYCKVSDATNITIKRVPEKDYYEITFTIDLTSVGSKKEENKCLVYAVFADKKKLSDALRAYNKKYSNAIIEWKKYEVQQKGQQAVQQNELQRYFEISSFGYHNCDHPTLQDGKSILASYKDNENNKLPNITTSLIDYDINSCYRSNNFRYNPNSRNALLGVDSEDNFYIFSVKEFFEFSKNNNSKEYEFTMKKIKPASYQEIENALYNL